MIAKIKAVIERKILFRNLVLKRIYNLPIRLIINIIIGAFINIAIKSTREKGLLMYGSIEALRKKSEINNMN